MEENKGNIIIYELEDGTSRIDVKVENETVWLTKNQITQLFSTNRQNIEYHIKNIYESNELQESSTCKKILQVQREGSRDVKREVDFYNLDMIISVGYRVNNVAGVRFRQWATKRLAEYMVKGFTLDDERLKGKGNKYLDELVQRIKEIRASELNFYQKVRDAFSLSKDYMENKKETGLFFANIQNKLFHAIVGKTAAELICERADHELANMGLSCFNGTRVRKADVIIAKNYLKENELKSLEKLVVMFLDFIENYIERTKEPIYTNDWKYRADEFLNFYKYKLLDGYGTKSNKEAEDFAESEYTLFDKERKRQEKIEADQKDLKEIEELKKELKKIKK